MLFFDPPCVHIVVYKTLIAVRWQYVNSKCTILPPYSIKATPNSCRCLFCLVATTYSSAAWGVGFCWRWVLIFWSGGMWGRVACQRYMSTKLHGVASSSTIFLIIITLSEISMNIFLPNIFCYQHISSNFPAFSEWVFHPASMHLCVTVGVDINTEIGCGIF